MALRRHAAKGLLLPGLLVLCWSSVAAAERLYVNTYGSDWGLWVRGHCLLGTRDGIAVLELEEVALEPNRGYPQALEVAGFRLAVAYLDAGLDAGSGAARREWEALGPEVAHAVALAPGEVEIVSGVVLDLPPLRPPGAGEVRLLLLQVVMASGTPFPVEVARVRGG